MLNPSELLKRKREIGWALALSVLIFVLTWFELQMASVSRQLPLEHSIFFFGLVNFNIILLLLLLFLIFRNVVKVFVERRGKIIGSSLKAKLIASFVVFCTVPTTLIFLVSVFYINSSFDKWFSIKVSSVLRDALEVNQEYIFSAKRRNYHFANQISAEIRPGMSSSQVQGILRNWQRKVRLDAVEYYPQMIGRSYRVLSDDLKVPAVPPPPLEFLRKGLVRRIEASMSHNFEQGSLVRTIVPLERGRGAIIVSSFLPLSLTTKTEDISAVYEDFKNINPLQYPIKSIYMIILVMMTLVIILGATWFGIHLARELSVPIATLGEATQRVTQGDYRPVKLNSGSDEMNRLIENFNVMMENLSRSEKEVLEANHNMAQTLARLDEHSRYVEVVLSNVSTAVVSCDQNEVITTVNQHAGKLLKINREDFIGKKISEVLPPEKYALYQEVLNLMREDQVTAISRELKVEVQGEELPLYLNLTLLQDEVGHQLGAVVVFDDLTMLLNAQRAAAWTEVARRIAHEIKNPLTPIKLSAQRLEKRFGASLKDPVFSSSIKMIIQQTDEMKKLVNEFSNFARLPKLRPVVSSLTQLVDETLGLYIAAHKNIHFVFEPDVTLPEFRFDPDQMRRVFINLIENSIAAVADVRLPRITCRVQYDETLRLARISVFDNGMGIPDENLEQVFEPYFSTKTDGTGLGLAIVRRIVEDHSGFIRALKNDPVGTKMIIELPVWEQDWLQVSQPVGPISVT